MGLAVALLRRLAPCLSRAAEPEAAPIRLGQRRISVLPTGAGVAFAAALAVMLVASINYGLNLGYAIVFLLGGVGVASMIHAARNLLDLAVRPGQAAPVFAGEAAEFHVLVGNSSARRRAALTLRRAGARRKFDLPADATLDLALAVPTCRRGLLPLGRVVLETRYPLGLVRAWSVVTPDCTCVVYPAPERAPPPLPGDSGADAGRAARAGDDDFAGLRSHRAADSPRHVAWKAIARGAPMLTKEFAGADGGTTRLDWDALPADLDVEARLSRLAAWVIAAEGASLAFSLTLPDGRSGPESGRLHAAACLRRLALFHAANPAHA